ncbi:MAG: hypothetical protein ACREOU_03070 [Candidatus Eiseniibacteriota bacterium]
MHPARYPVVVRPDGLSLAPGALPWLIGGAIVLALLAVWAYRSIAPSLRSNTRTLLAGLRAFALVALAFLLARPLLSLAGQAAGKGSVVVLTDVSRSMDLPADSIPAGKDARTRREIAEKSADLVARNLSGRFRVVRKTFAGTVADSVPAAERERTSLGEALQASLVGLENARGVVVVSDGSQTAGRDAVAAARELGLPVAAIPVGEVPGNDVAVVDVLANPTSRVGQETPVEVRVRALGPPRRAKIELREGATVLTSEEVALPGGGAEVARRMKYRPVRPGLQVFEVSTPESPGEWTAVNNRHAYAQEVLPDRQRVLVLAGSYHWDWTWARRAIATDSAYAAEHWVAAKGRFDRVDRGSGSGSGGAAAAAGLPQSPGALRPYALVVLIGMDEGTLSPGVAQAIAGYVSAGGSAIVMGGAARQGVLALGGSPIGTALRLARAPGQVPLAETGVTLTEDGRQADLVRLDEDPAANFSLWSALPPVENVQPLVASAEDEVLAVDARGRVPVVLERRAGRGRALIVNGASTFRWGFSGNDLEAGARYERLWGNLLRAFSEPAQTEPLRLVPERPLVTRGEPVRLAATLQDAAFRPVTEARVNVKVSGPVSREVVLESRGQGGYGTVLDNLPPGRYTASATATVGGRSAGSANAEFWVDAQSIEWQDVAPDAGLLAQVAQASGGRTVKPGREGDVAAALAVARPRAARDASVRLWESPFVFAILASILSAEWWIRRRRGLA